MLMSTRLLPAIIFAALLSTTARAQSSDVSGEITLTAYSGIFQDKYEESVIKPFMAKYPNVKVSYFASNTSSAMLGNLRSQAGDPQTDVVIFDVSTSLIGDKEDLLAPLSTADVPNLADLVPQAIVKEGYGPAVTFDNLVVIYNTQVFPTAPTSLSVLWDKAYAGKTAVTSMPSILGSGHAEGRLHQVGQAVGGQAGRDGAGCTDLRPQARCLYAGHQRHRCSRHRLERAWPVLCR
jgi:putative spermidine/putrescine transport system substrate-binding protein